MVDTKISALTSGTALVATDRIPAARSPFASDDNRYISGSMVRAFALQVDDGDGLKSTESGNANLLLFTSEADADEYLRVINNDAGDTSGGRTLGPGLYAEGSTTDPRFTLGTLGLAGEYRAVVELRGQPSYDSNTSYAYLRITGGQNHASVVIESTTDNSSHAPLTLKTKGTDSLRFKFNSTANFIEVTQENTASDSAAYHWFFSNYSSPAANDWTGGAYWTARNSVNAQTDMIEYSVWLESVTDGAEYASFHYAGMSNGVYVDFFRNGGNGAIFGSGTTFPGFGNVYLSTAGAQVRTNPTTVGALISAATAGAGARAFVTDANSTTFASVAAGSGSNGVPVYSDGTNWRIG